MSTLRFGLILALFAAASTLIGWALIALRRQVSERFLAFTLLLVAGAMIAVSFAQILPTSMRAIGSALQPLLWFGIGILLIWILTRIDFTSDPQSKVAQSAFVIAFAIGLHNLPEGTATIASTLVDLETGITTAIAVALHNIPEGIAIATTSRLAGFGKAKTLLLTLLATFAEMVGAVAVFFFGEGLSSAGSARLLAVVAGIMVTISARELIPFSARILLAKRNG
jgi:ZIP family zinc transporter